MEDSPQQEASESINLQYQLATHLLELLENSNKTAFIDSNHRENMTKPPESKLLTTTIELESTKAQLKDVEKDLKQKARLLEEDEEKLERLSRRLAVSPWTPYALTQKHQFNMQAGPHDCLCIVCGEKMKTHDTFGEILEVIVTV